MFAHESFSLQSHSSNAISQIIKVAIKLVVSAYKGGCKESFDYSNYNNQNIIQIIMIILLHKDCRLS